ncbi:unnamed protein product [Toxocara canis]|uniref:V-type proton ATPase subunit a n=1 Tax=Toxocara canis TaxID=6265 RepID=A0A183U5K9_TOXCA|nr:unnamed protein product [Toxocara canis]
MFGDLGHGLIMFLAALFFIMKEKQLEAARISDEVKLRFILGVLHVTSFIYNDAFSKSFNLFGSSWRNIYSRRFLDDQPAERFLMFTPEWAYYNVSVGPYPMGVDPIWNLAENNKLSFLNSLKMKTSVIIGISQMTFGVLLSYQNYKFVSFSFCSFPPFFFQNLFRNSEKRTMRKNNSSRLIVAYIVVLSF